MTMTDTLPEPRYRLALFPLPVVLLPGTSMPLHIFEPRYRDMVRDCLASDMRFGMVYHDWDRQGPFLSEEGRIGCIAEIRSHQGLSDGRSFIAVHGTERFRIVDGIESETAYFEALVSPYPDTPQPDRDALTASRRASIELFHAVIASLAERPEQLPSLEPDQETSFLLAQTIGVDPSWHQQLLELRDEQARLKELDKVFRAALE
jgi:Lon protease-like protein